MNASTFKIFSSFKDRDSHAFEILSGRRGSNSRPIAWKAIALPTELLPLFFQPLMELEKSVEGEGFEPSKPKQRIYSPSHLTALEPLQTCSLHRILEPPIGIEPMTY